MHSFARGLWGGTYAAVWLGWIAGAVAQSPTPEPTPKFDVQESPLTAEELAKELGYRFYGNTWKFSEPTFVRVREWSQSGRADEVPAQPPADARWSDLYAPDKPLTRLTIHALQRSDKKPVGDPQDGLSDVDVVLKVDVTGQAVPEDAPPNSIMKKITWKDTRGTATSFSFYQKRHQSYGDEWRFANGNLGVMFASLLEADAAAAMHPDQPGQQDTAEASIRTRNEAALLAAPLNLLYYKGEIRAESEQERQKPSGRSYDVPVRRAVWLMTLECSREPFKADAPPIDSFTPAAATPGP